MHLHPPAQLPNESSDAYQRFLAWLLPEGGLPRSMARVAREMGLHPSTLKEQADRFDWRARGNQHDRRRVEVQASQAGALAVEAGRDALALCKQLREQLARLVAETADSDDPELVLQAGLDGSKILERLVRTERLILGLSTQNQSVVIRDESKRLPDLRSLSDAEVNAKVWCEELTALMEKKLRAEPHDAAELAALVAKVA